MFIAKQDGVEFLKIEETPEGRFRIELDLTRDQADLLKCQLELDLEEGGGIEDLGFECPDGDDYVEWHDSLLRPISALYGFLVGRLG